MKPDSSLPEDQPATADLYTRPDEDPQQAVARARAQVLGGRGPGADQAEIVRHTRERPTLGAVPPPVEREMVHRQTEKMRGGAGRVLPRRRRSSRSRR